MRRWLMLLLLLLGIAGPLAAQTVIEVDAPGAINVNNKGNGRLPVAMLCTETFDPATVDVTTVLVNGVAPLRCALDDPDPDDPTACIDLTCQVLRRDLALTCADTALTVTAATLTGGALTGEALFRPVPCRGRP